MKKTKLTLAALMIIALIATTAFAWGPGRGGGRWGGNGFGYGGGGYDCPRYGQQSAVNLTQEQQDQLSALKQNFIDETYTVRSEKFSKSQELRLLMQTSNPDKAKATQLSNDILELDKVLMEKQINYQLEVKKIAPEQAQYGGMGFGKGPGFGKGRGGFQGSGRY